MGIFFFALWPLNVFLQYGVNPVVLHQTGIINLVIGSFAVGFLLTALPRFTGTAKATVFDITVLLIVSIAEFVLLICGLTLISRLLAIGKFIYLFHFARRRTRDAAQGIMPNMSWLFLALTAVMVGNIGMIISDNWPRLTNVMLWQTISKALYSRGFLTGIFIAMGSRLVPMLTGIKTKPLTTNRIFHPLHFWLALVFYSGLVIEVWYLQLALACQALVLFIEIIYLWRLWQPPVRSSRAISLWIASWLLVFGTLASSLWPDYRTDLYHIAFIGVFMVGTITVASHVLVMHEHRDETLLARCWPLGVVIALLMLAMLTRVSARLASYWQHLGYAGALAALTLLIWGFFFLRMGSQPTRD